MQHRPHGNGDGFVDLHEYIAGTDPTNPVSHLRLLNVSNPSGPDSTHIEWQGGLTATHIVESCNALSGGAPVWTPIFTNYPPTVTNIVIDPGTNTVLFYRIRVP